MDNQTKTRVNGMSLPLLDVRKAREIEYLGELKKVQLSDLPAISQF